MIAQDIEEGGYGVIEYPNREICGNDEPTSNTTFCYHQRRYHKDQFRVNGGKYRKVKKSSPKAPKKMEHNCNWICRQRGYYIAQKPAWQKSMKQAFYYKPAKVWPPEVKKEFQWPPVEIDDEDF
ncbi:MAG: hypothetical protein Q9164_007369 [Protoblastenia rupestris]